MNATGSPSSSMYVRVMYRVLDPAHRFDYLILGVLAAWPAVYAAMIGAHHSVGSPEYVGYWESANWMVYLLGLPLSLFVLRWATHQIVPDLREWPPSGLPGVVELVRSEEGRRRAYAALRAAVLSPWNVVAALAITTVFHIVDIWFEVLRFYVGPQEVTGGGWSAMHLSGAVPKWQNLLLAGFAYPLQFALLMMLLWFVVLALRHNLFFLDRVYQRRRVPPGRESAYLVIDLNDPDRCFGFRHANEAFNVQVVCLMLAGAGLLFSRFPTVTAEHTRAVYGTFHNLIPFLAPVEGATIDVLGLFPSFGQVSIATVWLLALGIFSLPAFVKLLPRLPFVGSVKARRTVTGYLREFLPDDHWPYDEAPTAAEVDILAARFAENAFWPTGANRARTLFVGSFFVFMVILFPLKPSGHIGEFLTAYAVMLGLAFACTAVAFKAIAWWLADIDPRLVEVAASAGHATPVAPVSPVRGTPADRYAGRIFISYRRDDTSPYAVLLRKKLSDVCHADRVFWDRETIPGGGDVGEAIGEAIATADVVLVLIGPQWLAPDERGAARVHDPEDWVRLEVASALARPNLLVIPVLVGGATMPPADALPELLKPLARRNAIEITDSRWDYDVGQLVRAMRSGTRLADRAVEGGERS